MLTLLGVEALGEIVGGTTFEDQQAEPGPQGDGGGGGGESDDDPGASFAGSRIWNPYTGRFTYGGT